ncbi:hypothetical protein L249_5316 [Ophiocordyceps polyrhachis-furcata BCC 54312]|uniref:AMP-activated protein kinase glycogen-binding domain-containing protein n=1 Tax=Ophiocordyceps polyrhachis-furcata BCC 54312 TaxID=1330021 RepID=A0A367L947_9HYPO|nr:hypothetical protein L249_5316 [Ophiocordyceps polyrhachis-furcata BCC 54312]
MDPNTTLVTFLLQTDASVQSVNLIGSWDGFSACYPMKPDFRRGRGQWRGCHSFKDIICDDDAAVPRRDGGLKMGATYYYYYEVDGCVETYDPAEPTTTACPYLPGQTVNTLSVPVERPERHRSASLNSLHAERFKTMDPEAKFATPCPPAVTVAAETAAARRLLSAPGIPRALLPAPPPSWKRFFSRKSSCRASDDGSDLSTPPSPTGLVAVGDVSHHESLRRFLPAEDSYGSVTRPMAIPEDIAEEAAADDSFASLTLTENDSSVASASLLPIRSCASSDVMAKTRLMAAPSPSGSLNRMEASPRQTRWSALTPVEDDPPSFYDSYDEDEVLSSNDGDNFSHAPLPSLSSSAERAFKVYSLPRQADEVKGAPSLRSPRLLARTDSGLDELVSELGWMVDVIGSK